MLFNQHIDDLRYVTLKSWVLKDVGLRLLFMVVPVKNKYKFIFKFTCHKRLCGFNYTVSRS